MAISLAPLLLLFHVPPSSPQQHSFVTAAGCAFCGGHTTPVGASCLRRQPRVTTLSGSRGSSRRRGKRSPDSGNSPSVSPLLFGGGGRTVSSCSDRRGLMVVAASRWEEDVDVDVEDEDAGGRGRRRRAGRKPLRAPWEDIQWSNPSRSAAREGSKMGWGERGGEEIGEDDEEEVLGLGQRRRARVQPRRFSPNDFEGGIEDDIDDERPRRPRPRRDARDVRDSAPLPSGWDTSEWFGGAQDANQGGLFNWARSFYNTVFWYGGASSEDEDELPAMNFQDLLERYDLPAGEQPSLRSRPIVPPEDLANEQDFRWRPSGRDSRNSAAAPFTAEATRRQRRRSRNAVVNDDVAEKSRRQPRREERPVERAQQEVGRRVKEREGGGNGSGGGGAGEDLVAIGQLRRKQRELMDREEKCAAGLQKVQERLDVVDATVELWMRRSAGMLSRGSSETDTDVLQAKRRIYGLKEEGQQLDSAMLELEGRVEGCRAKLNRVVQELRLLGADSTPQAIYTPDEERDLDKVKQAAPQTAETGTQGVEGDVVRKESPGLGAKLVDFDSLRLEPEKERDVATEAVSAAPDADV